jgi:hypothetical protein
MVDGMSQFAGLRYQVNDWYTNDVEELRRLQSLLEEAHARLRTVEQTRAESLGGGGSCRRLESSGCGQKGERRAAGFRPGLDRGAGTARLRACRVQG